MLVFNPDSEILLCSTPLESDNKNQLHFANEAAQEEYFLSTVVRTYDGTTYQRKDDVIRINANIEDLYNCNYVMYQNRNFTNKWFYAFITDMSFLNNSTTAITIETDVFQTWMFDVEIKPSFVSREHTSNDTIGANIVPENLETGPYVTTSFSRRQYNSMRIVVAATARPGGARYAGQLIDGSYSGLNFFDVVASDTGAGGVNDLLQLYEDEGRLDAVTSIFMVPEFVINPKMENVQVNGVYSGIDGYTPRNNKLYTSQYYYLKVSNSAGDAKTFNFEDFGKPTQPVFMVKGTYSMMATIWCYPTEYAGLRNDFNDGLVLNVSPQCAWNGNVFANWYAQKYVSNAISLGSAVGQAAIGFAIHKPTIARMGVMSALNSVASMYEHSKIPAQQKGNQSGNYDSISLQKVEFVFEIMSIKAEMARVIDDYFTMFGYQTNRVKVPNIGTRKNWNYVETQHINIVGDIPNDHMERLKAVYNSGVTIWNNPATFGDYSQANGVV